MSSKRINTEKEGKEESRIKQEEYTTMPKSVKERKVKRKRKETEEEDAGNEDTGVPQSSETTY